jgi:hypothetical protein
MTQAEKKESFLNSYRDSYGNLTESLKVSGIKSSDYIRFMEMPDFKKEVEAVRQIQDDLINSKFLYLVESGDVRAVIKAKELLAERKEGVNIDEMKANTMIYLITHAETKSEILIAFCDWFRLAESTAESFYKKIIIEYNLKNETPFERSNRKIQNFDSSLSERFKNGELTNPDMLSELMTKSLYTAEHAFHPGDRCKATTLAMSIEKRMAEIQDIESRKNQISLSTLFERIDSAVFDAPVEKIREFEAQYNMIEEK